MSSRWSFGTNSTLGIIETTTIVKTTTLLKKATRTKCGPIPKSAFFKQGPHLNKKPAFWYQTDHELVDSSSNEYYNKYYFRNGELTLISGHTGKGKTTWLSDYSIDLGLGGVKTLWGSFELRVERLQSIQVRVKN